MRKSKSSPKDETWPSACPVRADFSASGPDRHVEALTDAHNLFGRILPLRQWLGELARRHDLEAARPHVVAALSKQYTQQRTILNWALRLAAAARHRHRARHHLLSHPQSQPGDAHPRAHRRESPRRTRRESPCDRPVRRSRQGSRGLARRPGGYAGSKSAASPCARVPPRGTAPT